MRSRSTTAATPIATRATSPAPLADYEQAIKLEPGYALALLQPRQRLLREARLRPRHRRLRPGDQAQPELRRWRYYNRGLAFRDKGDIDRAHRGLRPGDRSSSRRTRWPSTIAAWRYRSQGRSRPRARRASIRRSSSTPAWRWRSTTAASRFGMKGDTDRAIADFDQAIKLDPKDPRALQQPRLRLAQQGRHRPRRGGFRAGDQARCRTMRMALYNRGNAFYEKKDYDRAIADYDQAIKLEPELCRRLQQPRPGLRRQARLRPRHRGLRPVDQAQSERSRWSTTTAASPIATRARPTARIAGLPAGDQARSELRAGVLQPRHRLLRQARVRPRQQRPEHGDQDQSELRRRVPRSRHHQLRQARVRRRDRRRPTRRSQRRRTTRSRRTTAPAPTRTGATTTA